MNKLLSCAILISAAGINAEQCELVSTTALDPNICTESTRSASACKMRPEVADQLNAAQKDLERSGLGLKLFEAHCQPCTDEFIETSDGTIIPTPEECNRHCLGTSVDVTLVTNEGKELKMPCDFDDFCEKSKRSYMQGPEEALKNRDILEDAMVRNGFIPSEHSWWHFDIQNWQSYQSICNSEISCKSACPTKTEKKCAEACATKCAEICKKSCVDMCDKNCDEICTQEYVTKCEKVCRTYCDKKCSEDCCQDCNNTCATKCINTCKGECAQK